VTARPRHLRLVAANDDPRSPTRSALFAAAWGAPSFSRVHEACVGHIADARSSLLLEAARTVLLARPPVMARTSGDADRALGGSDALVPWGTPERTRTCRPLVLSGAQLAFLEDLALLRRSRPFRCDEGPAAEVLEAAPEAGTLYVQRLLHPTPRPRGPGDGNEVHVYGRRRRPSGMQRLVEALRATFVRCVRWASLAARPRGALGGDAGGS
jgi:hypothetical protein